jgi:hypothetical protein
MSREQYILHNGKHLSWFNQLKGIKMDAEEAKLETLSKLQKIDKSIDETLEYFEK